MGRKTKVRWTDIRDSIVQKIINLTVQGYSPRMISCAIKYRCSHETVRQRLVAMKRMWPESFTVAKTEWTSAKVARSLKCSRGTVNHLCCTRQITGCRKIGAKNGLWLITQEGIDQLKQHPSICGKVACIICLKKFKGCNTNKKTCSERCAKTHYENLRTALLTTDPNPETLKGKTLKIWKAVQRCKGQHVWVTIKEASSRTLASPMQVRWYVMRGIIASTHDTTRTSTKTGNGIILCDLRQVRAMARVLAS